MTMNRQLFLPKNLEKCELAEVDGWKKDPYRWKYHGFDQSGRFYSILNGSRSWKDCVHKEIAFLSFNSVEQKIEKRFVVLKSEESKPYYSIYYDCDKLLYDANLTRWFSIRGYDDSMEVGNRIIIHSGCIEKVELINPDQMELRTEINIEEVTGNNRLILEYDERTVVHFVTLKRDIDHGNYLVLLTRLKLEASEVQDKKSSTMYLIKYNCESISQYKCITLNHQKIERYFDEWPQNLFEVCYAIFIDSETERVYLQDVNPSELFPGNEKYIDCFNFDGELIFSHSYEEFLFVQEYHFFTYLRSEFFIAITSDLNVVLFRINVDGISVVKQYPLPLLFSPNNRPSFDFRVVNFFQKDILHVKISNDVFDLERENFNPNSTSKIFVFDVSSGIQIIRPLEIESFVQSYDFNWSLGEIMYTTGNSLDFHRTHTKTLSIFMKTQSTDKSLKHQARLASLKYFTDEYLNSKLPKCLLEYLCI